MTADVEAAFIAVVKALAALSPDAQGRVLKAAEIILAPPVVPGPPVAFACNECRSMRATVDEDNCCKGCGGAAAPVDLMGRVCFVPVAP